MRATVSTGSGGRKKPRRLDTRPGRLSVIRSAGIGVVCQATLKTDPLATPKTDPRRNGVCRSTTMIRVEPVGGLSCANPSSKLNDLRTAAPASAARGNGNDSGERAAG